MISNIELGPLQGAKSLGSSGMDTASFLEEDEDIVEDDRVENL